jgi:uncharacterized protein YjbJ (UPF0337 family)
LAAVARALAHCALGGAAANIASHPLFLFHALLFVHGPNQASAGPFGERLAPRDPGEFANMNWDQVEGNWKQMKGLVAKKWGKLTEDDLAVAKGNRQLLEGRIQERYGIAKEIAEKELDEFLHADPAEVSKGGDPVTTETLKQGM